MLNGSIFFSSVLKKSECVPYIMFSEARICIVWCKMVNFYCIIISSSCKIEQMYCVFSGILRHAHFVLVFAMNWQYVENCKC